MMYANIQIASLPAFCGIQDKLLMGKTLQSVTRECTYFNLATHDEFGESSQGLIQMKDTTFKSIFDMYRSEPKVVKFLPYLNIKQLAAVGLFRSVKFFFLSLNEISNIIGVNYTNVSNKTIYGMLLESRLFVNEIYLQYMLNDFVSNKNVINIIKNTFATKIKIANLFDEKLFFVFLNLQAQSQADEKVFLHYQDIISQCSSTKRNDSISDLAMKCVNSSYLRFVPLFGSIYSIDDIKLPTKKYDVMNFDLNSLFFSSNTLRNYLLKKSKEPLVVLAHRNKMKLERLVNSSVIDISVQMLNVTPALVIKTFDIPNITDILQNMNLLNNVKQLYTCSLNTIFDLMTERISVAYIMRREYPLFVTRLISRPFKELKAIYNFNDVRDFGQYTLVALVMDLFGMNQDEFLNMFKLPEASLVKLKKTRVHDISLLTNYSKAPLGIPDISPEKCITTVLTFYPKLQDLLTAPIFDLGNHSIRHPYGLIQDLIPKNISMRDFDRYFINEWGERTHLNASEFLQVFKKKNITLFARSLNQTLDEFVKNSFGFTIRLTVLGKFYTT